MIFIIEINVADLPKVEYMSQASEAFKKSPGADLILACHPNYERSVCTRTGYAYRDQTNKCGPGDVVTFKFDDFKPGLGPDAVPPWYEYLKDRIVATTASVDYGPAQGIRVTERREFGSAVACVRHQQASWGSNGELVFTVKIAATGPSSLKDALALHAQLLAEGQSSVTAGS